MEIMLVRESISFERGVDPKVILGIGEYSLIKKWMDDITLPEIHYRSKACKYTINNDLTINVEAVYPEGAFDISYDDLIIPEYIKFGNIKGDFAACFETKESLRSFPSYVSGYVHLYYKIQCEFTEKDIYNICNIDGPLTIVKTPR